MKNRSTDINNIQAGLKGNDLITETIAFWNEHSGRDISSEDAREMIEAVVGYFSLLAEWDSQETKLTNTGKTNVTP